MYLMSLGEFDYSGNYTEGPNRILAFVAFLLGTFICCIVFMNMLIAIMGGTFAEMEGTKDQAMLSE